MKSRATNYTFKSLEELNRTITVLPKAKDWPSKSLETKLDENIKYLNSFSNLNMDSNVSEDRIIKLQKLLDNFYNDKWHNIHIITDSNKNNLVKILYNVDKLFVNEKPLNVEQNRDSLYLLLKKTDKELIYKTIEPLLKLYLSNGCHTDSNKYLIKYQLDRLPKDSSYFIQDFILYSDKDYLFQCINPKNNSYLSALKEAGVEEKYIYTDYFSQLFYNWIISKSKINSTILIQNKELLKTSSVDQCKIIYAYSIVYLYKELPIDEAKEEITKITNKVFNQLQGDNTEKSFWTIAQNDLLNEKIEKKLKEAFRIMNIFLFREIIKKFFDYMGNTNDSTTVERSEFWRPYCSSKQFIDIRIVLTGKQKNLLFESLNYEERVQFNKHLIINKSNSNNESPALIIIFNKKTIVEFTNLGNATQVYNSDDFLLQSILKTEIIDNIKDLKKYNKQSVFVNPDGIGTIMHSGYWKGYTRKFLKWYGIMDGNN